MSSIWAVAALAIGLVLVVGGAESFFKGLLAAAERFHVSPFIVAVVVSGFELENLAAGIAANAKGLRSRPPALSWGERPSSRLPSQGRGR